MGRLWDDSFAGQPIATFERGLVWEGPYGGSDSEAIASYGKGLIWSGPYRGMRWSAIGSYADDRIWNGQYQRGEAVGSYSDGEIFEGPYQLGSVVGRYEGSPPGAAAAALMLLLGGGETSDDSDSHDTDESSESEDDESSESEDNDEDDDDGGSNDEDSSYAVDDSWEPAYVAPPPEPPESVARRSFETAQTPAELRRLKMAFEQQLPANVIEGLYLPQIERQEAAVFETRLRSGAGRTEDELEAANWGEFRRLCAEGHTVLITDLESFKVLQAVRITREMREREAWDVEMLARVWIDRLPDQMIAAKRRLAELRESAASEDLKKIEPVEFAPTRALESYFFHHRATDCAVEVMHRVRDKHFLAQVCRESLNEPLVAVARKNYFEILRYEHATRSWPERVHYNLFFRDREHRFLWIVKKVDGRWRCV